MTVPRPVDLESLRHIAARKRRPLVFCGRCGFREFMSLARVRTIEDVFAAHRERGRCPTCGEALNLWGPPGLFTLLPAAPTEPDNARPMPFGVSAVEARLRRESMMLVRSEREASASRGAAVRRPRTRSRAPRRHRAARRAGSRGDPPLGDPDEKGPDAGERQGPGQKRLPSLLGSRSPAVNSRRGAR
jgi:hypothetical protein